MSFFKRYAWLLGMAALSLLAACSCFLPDNDAPAAVSVPESVAAVPVSEPAALSEVVPLPETVPAFKETEAWDAPVFEPSPAAAPAVTPKPLTVNFAGDILLDRGVKRNYIAGGYDGIFSDDGTIDASDFLMINLEFPFSSRGEPEDKE